MLATDAQLAQSLINTRHKPQGWDALMERVREARDYHKLQPYPIWQFKRWDVATAGPLPRCMPLPRRIVRRGAKFLFGRGIEITCPKNEALETFLRDVWQGNQMPARSTALAEDAGVDGMVVLKFSYDPDTAPTVTIQTLKLDHVRLFFHPHDTNRLLLARVQYRYYDAATGSYFWYREEWTSEKQVTYSPLPDSELVSKTGTVADPDTFDGWAIEAQAENPFGLIPLHPIKNIETDDLYGAGDLWDLYRLVDDLNLVWYQMRRSNQFDSSINALLIDLELDEKHEGKPLAPGEPIEATSTTDGQQGKAEIIGGENGLRTALMDYARELRKEIEDAAGTVNVSQGEITNKGNLTQAVLVQLHALLIETTQEKRKTYGQGGIELFLEAVARGLQKHGVALGVTNSPDSFDVQVKWAEPFDLTEEEKQLVVGRTQEEQAAGYLTQDRAVERIAQMENIRDVKALKSELEKEPRPTVTEEDDAERVPAE